LEGGKIVMWIFIILISVGGILLLWATREKWFDKKLSIVIWPIIALAILITLPIGYSVSYGEYVEPITIEKTIIGVYPMDYKVQVIFDDGTEMMFFNDDEHGYCVSKLTLNKDKYVSLTVQEERWFFNMNSRYKLINIEVIE